MTYRKKLIEVALPLEAINKESTRESYIYKGNPSAIHKWWSGKPLATCRAVLFASLVDDPSNDLPEGEAKEERNRLFAIIEDLVKWENLNDENVLGRARAEIMKSTGGNLPLVLDPFCGGGSIPLEAQRLGLEAQASDLNPIAVLITKALIEIPPKFAGQPPVNPEARKTIGHGEGWRGARGLAEDIRYYGKWMRDEAEKRIGHLYPKGPNGETVIAWLWARTVVCPNPACGAWMPLTSTFWLSTKKGKKTWVEPIVDRDRREIRFEVKKGEGAPPDPPKIGRGAKFRCLVCEQVSEEAHIKAEGNAGRMGQQLMAVVLDAPRGRTYVTPYKEHTCVAEEAQPKWVPDQRLSTHPQYMGAPRYGIATHKDLYTPRQLAALTTFADLILKAHDRVQQNAVAAGLSDDDVALRDSGKGARAYADAVTTYMAFALDKVAAYGNSLVPWYTKEDRPQWVFGQQTLGMVWNFAEVNAFTNVGGGVAKSVDIVADSVGDISNRAVGVAYQGNASSTALQTYGVISTDPPYYDNVPYADLSDFFYVWLRHILGEVYPDLFATLLTPKSQELVADSHRHQGRDRARAFFEKGLKDAFRQMRNNYHSSYPLTIYYAFKQSELYSNADGTAATASTGWETMLEGLLTTGFQITGTWPMRTERSGRVRETGSNALASSIVLVCRPRSEDTPPATRQEFVRALRRELPHALSVMMSENVAPVDLAQATIGPGMAIYSRYSMVVEADGSPMRIRTALQIINQSLDEHLSEAEGDVDSHTRFALTWFEQRGMQEGPYGEAETIATARGVSVRSVQDAGILEARAGKVRLLPRERLAEEWDPATDSRLTNWEVVQHLIRALETEGETGAARLLAKVGDRGKGARDLAYRLYGICERKKWAEEALAYNGLVVSWPEISRLASQNPEGTEAQTSMEF